MSINDLDAVVMQVEKTVDETKVTVTIKHRALADAELTKSDYVFLHAFQRGESIADHLLELETYVRAIERTLRSTPQSEPSEESEQST